MDKSKGKKALYSISTPEERREMELFEVEELNKNYRIVKDSMNRLEAQMQDAPKSKEMIALFGSLSKGFDNITGAVQKMQEGHSRHTKATVESFKEMQEEFLNSLKGLRSVMESQDFNKNAGPLYKTMINAISAVGKEVKDKPVPVWNYPQYASVSVRDTSFANINPSIAGFNITTPYDTVNITYSGSNPTIVVYVSNGKTVATLTLSYSGSNVISVVRT